jgi:uncharacterized protein with PQ loop repeat
MSLSDGFGYAGGILLSICMLPQLFHMWKRRVSCLLDLIEGRVPAMSLIGWLFVILWAYLLL